MDHDDQMSLNFIALLGTLALKAIFIILSKVVDGVGFSDYRYFCEFNHSSTKNFANL
jgi:hypothetical protein